MKIYISVDMEGVIGTFNWKQDEKDRSSVRKYMTDHIKWVIDGIKKSKKNKDVEEILIADSHAGGDNLPYEITEYDDRIFLVSGYPRPQYMMPALDQSFDIAFFIGYHAGVGALRGSMDHTYASSRIHKIWINDMIMNESLINAAYAGEFGIPVALVIGDEALGRELMMQKQMPWVKYVSSKEAVSRYAAKLRPVFKVKEETINAVVEALNEDINKIPILKFESPAVLRIEFQTTAMADVASLMPDTKRIDGRTIEFKHEDYKVMFDGIMALVTLASTVV